MYHPSKLEVLNDTLRYNFDDPETPDQVKCIALGISRYSADNDRYQTIPENKTLRCNIWIAT